MNFPSFLLALASNSVRRLSTSVYISISVCYRMTRRKLILNIVIRQGYDLNSEGKEEPHTVLADGNGYFTHGCLFLLAVGVARRLYA